MLVLAIQLFGGIASPMAISYIFVLCIAAFLFSPYFVAGLFILEIVIIYLSIQFGGSSQLNFVTNSFDIFIWEISVLSISAFLFFILGSIYFRQKKKLDKLEGFSNQLVAEKVKSEAVLQSMSDGVFVVDSQKKLVFLNEAALRLMKIDKKQKEKVLGHFYGNIFKLKLNEKDLDHTKDCPVQLAMTEGKSNFRKDLSVLTAYKKPVFVTFSSAPVVDAAGNTQGAVVIMRDITKEREIQRIQMEFVSIASHELLTPITQVQGHLSMVVDEGIGKLDDTAKKIINNAYQGIKRISRLVSDLMNVSRIEKGTLKINLSEIDIVEFIDAVVKDFQFEAQSSELILSFKKPCRGMPHIVADPDRLREVLNNLIVNAIKFTKKGGVTLGVSEKKDGTAIVSVTDTGIGIPKENILKLFEKFYQVDSSATREAQGTGLGLYISKMIIEKMKGRIWVESKLGKGSTFYFSLPKVGKVKIDNSNKKNNLNKKNKK